jgi:hypothetical protein
MMDYEAAERAAAAKWIEWATATATRCREYGDVLLANGIPPDLVFTLVEEYHRVLIAQHFNVRIEGNP